MKKSTKKALFAFVSANAIAFGTGVFVTGNLDPATWSQSGKVFGCFFSLLFSGTFALIIKANAESEDYG